MIADNIKIWDELNSNYFFLGVVAAQDIAFIIGIHSNRAKLMFSSVCWALERGFFFVGIWIYLSLFGTELWNWLTKYKTSIQKINIIHLKSPTNSINTSSHIWTFIGYWIVLSSMTARLFYIGKIKYSVYKKINRMETEI